MVGAGEAWLWLRCEGMIIGEATVELITEDGHVMHAALISLRQQLAERDVANRRVLTPLLE